MTHDEAMRRLMACPALPRGERGACASPVRVPHSVVHHWATLVSSSVVLGGKVFTGFGAVERSRAEWRRLAAPLRRARDERRDARNQLDACHKEVARAQFSEKMMQSQCSKAEKEMRDHLHRVIDEKNHLRDALDEACTWIMDSGFPAIVKHLREVAGGKESK